MSHRDALMLLEPGKTTRERARVVQHDPQATERCSCHAFDGDAGGKGSRGKEKEARQQMKGNDTHNMRHNTR